MSFASKRRRNRRSTTTDARVPVRTPTVRGKTENPQWVVGDGTKGTCISRIAGRCRATTKVAGSDGKWDRKITLAEAAGFPVCEQPSPRKVLRTLMVLLSVGSCCNCASACEGMANIWPARDTSERTLQNRNDLHIAFQCETDKCAAQNIGQMKPPTLCRSTPKVRIHHHHHHDHTECAEPPGPQPHPVPLVGSSSTTA